MVHSAWAHRIPALALRLTEANIEETHRHNFPGKPLLASRTIAPHRATALEWIPIFPCKASTFLTYLPSSNKSHPHGLRVRVCVVRRVKSSAIHGTTGWDALYAIFFTVPTKDRICATTGREMPLNCVSLYDFQTIVNLVHITQS